MDLQSVHDEYIDDTMYLRGWNTVSTIYACVRSGCRCSRGKVCDTGMFNHYLVEDCSPGTPELPTSSTFEHSEVGGLAQQETEPTAFPLYISPENVGACGMEEIRCAKHTLSATYSYYRRNVLKGSNTTTLLSCAIDGYKSPCFNILCYLVIMPKSSLPEGCVALACGSKDECMVLTRDEELASPLMEFMCYTGVSPLVTNDKFLSAVEKDENGKLLARRLWYTSFAFSKVGPNVLIEGSLGPSRPATVSSIPKARAVQTALVTVSILLTPKSLYGGKNPSTKLLTYFVHNVCHGGQDETGSESDHGAQEGSS